MLQKGDMRNLKKIGDKKGFKQSSKPFFIIFSKIENYLPLTTSLNFLPAENTGTVLAGILISLPV